MRHTELPCVAIYEAGLEFGPRQLGSKNQLPYNHHSKLPLLCSSINKNALLLKRSG